MDTFTGRFGPREIALGITFGVLLGLLPKANLLFVVFAVFFFLSHANIVIGVSATLVISFFAPWFYPWADLIGREILVSARGQQIIGTLFCIPVVPWTMLDNTVVLGTFLLGIVLFLPVFLIAWIPLKIILPKKKEQPPQATPPQTMSSQTIPSQATSSQV
ncbi:MAG: DUF2062 domain-containing protein [Planctomycetaceae bacterium]|jgi:uncharacterized protein (TIGR03546 family)|nr:DUF2062 domain-containing protein [Planctomycetaceae bacterium]